MAFLSVCIVCCSAWQAFMGHRQGLERKMLLVKTPMRDGSTNAHRIQVMAYHW